MARLAITVSPGASRTELVGRHGEGWKARVAPLAAHGRANRALMELLATALRIERERVRVVGGATSRRKLVEVDGLEAAEIGRRLEAAARLS